MNTGSVLAQFNITLSVAVSEPVQVDWFTSDGTAKAGVDYAANKGTVVFAPGETTKGVDILVYGRAVGSQDRSFFVEMLPPTNAILGASIGECIITVDTTGSTPVTAIIVPTGPVGPRGKSAYQSYLDTTTDNPPLSEADWVESLKGDPAEIAQEVASLIDVGATTLTAEGTETLPTPDSTTVKAVARRVAYAAGAKIATMTLAGGDNLVSQADMTGDTLDMASPGLYPRIRRGTVMLSPKWSVDSANKLLIKGAVAGDVLYVCQYDTVSGGKDNTNAREVWRRTLAEAGITLVDGSFESGATASTATEAVWHIAGGQCYTWNGVLPKTVPEKSTPASSGGVAVGAWTTVSGEALRSQISLEGYTGVNVAQRTLDRVAAAAGNTIRFGTWNIQNGYPIFVYYDDPDGGDARRFNRDEDSPLYISEINEHLLRMGIDIVGFQEVVHRWDAPISLRALYPYADAAEGRTDQDANGVTVNRVYSNAVMSMKAISSFSNTVLKARVGTTDGNSVVKTVINWNGTPISMYSAHLAGENATDADRIAQLTTVAGILSADTNTHIVLVGDFNLHLDAQFTAITSIGFSMVNSEVGPNTYNGSKGWVWHMDRLFHKGFSAQGAWAVDEIPRELGDHKPVWVDLTI